MNKGVLLVFDDDETTLKIFEGLNRDTATDLEFIGVSSVEDYKKKMLDQGILNSIRALILDLAESKEEEYSGSFKVVEEIKKSYNSLRVPIFIHSAHLDQYSDFPNEGTVFKIGKDKDAPRMIFNKLKLFLDSGFIDLFCPNGVIEGKVMSELHKAFTEQFRDEEIEKIIKTVNPNPAGKFKERVSSIFERIAFRSLMNNLMNPQPTDDGKGDEIELNVVEHYYRRTNGYKVWTGDIFKYKNGAGLLYVVTPRCNILKETTTHILLCEVSGNLPKKEKERGAAAKNNPEYSKYRFRYLPKSPVFGGGNVDIATTHMVNRSELINGEIFEYQITVSDELANEISGMFGAYFLRTGITEFELEELEQSHAQESA